MTRRALDNAGIPYTVTDLSTDEDALELVRALDYSTVPVLIADPTHRSGFRPDKVAAFSTGRAGE